MGPASSVLSSLTATLISYPLIPINSCFEFKTGERFHNIIIFGTEVRIHLLAVSPEWGFLQSNKSWAKGEIWHVCLAVAAQCCSGSPIFQRVPKKALDRRNRNVLERSTELLALYTGIVVAGLVFWRDKSHSEWMKGTSSFSLRENHPSGSFFSWRIALFFISGKGQTGLSAERIS